MGKTRKFYEIRGEFEKYEGNKNFAEIHVGGTAKLGGHFEI